VLIVIEEVHREGVSKWLEKFMPWSREWDTNDIRVVMFWAHLGKDRYITFSALIFFHDFACDFVLSLSIWCGSFWFAIQTLAKPPLPITRMGGL
jgi:hypothetical protein